MEAANQVAAYISKLDQQPIRWIIIFLICIRCKHMIYVDLKANETFFKTNTNQCSRKKIGLGRNPKQVHRQQYEYFITIAAYSGLLL